MVRPEGLEPPTLWSEAKCSNPLSYGRMSRLTISRVRRFFKSLLLPALVV